MRIFGFLLLFVCFTVGWTEDASSEEVDSRTNYHYLHPMPSYPYVPHPVVVPFVPSPGTHFTTSKKKTSKSSKELLRQLSETLLAQHLSKIKRLSEQDGTLTESRIQQIVDDIAGNSTEAESRYAELPEKSVSADTIKRVPSLLNELEAISKKYKEIEDDKNSNEVEGKKSEAAVKARNGEEASSDGSSEGSSSAEGKSASPDDADKPLTEQRMLQLLLEEAEAEKQAEEAEVKELPEEKEEKEETESNEEASGRSFSLNSATNKVALKPRQVFVLPEEPRSKSNVLLKYFQVDPDYDSFEDLHQLQEPILKHRPSIIYVVKEEPIYKRRFQNYRFQRIPYVHQHSGRALDVESEGSNEEEKEENNSQTKIYARSKPAEEPAEEPKEEEVQSRQLNAEEEKKEYQSVLERFAARSMQNKDQS